MRTLSLLIILALFSSAVYAEGLSDSVRNSLEKIEADFSNVTDQIESEPTAVEIQQALQRAYESMAAANHLLRGQTPAIFLGLHPKRNETALIVYRDLESLSLEQKALAYNLLRRINTRIQKLAWPNGLESSASDGALATLHEVLNEQRQYFAAEHLRLTELANRPAPAPAPVRAQPMAERVPPPDRKQAKARIELEKLKEHYRQLQEVALYHSPAEPEEAPPAETNAQKTIRLMGVMNAVNAVNSGQAVSADQLSILNNLNAHSRGPVASANREGENLAPSTFEQKLDSALGEGDAIKAVALLKAEISSLAAKLEAQSQFMSVADQRVVANAKLAATHVRTGWSLPKLPAAPAILDHVGNALDRLGKLLPEIKITVPKIRLPKLTLPTWTSSTPPPPTRTYSRPAPRERYDYDSPSHYSGNYSDGEGCLRAMKALMGVGAIGVGGLIGTAVVTSVWNDQAYVESNSMEPNAQLEAIAQIIEGKGTWGTPDLWTQTRGVARLSDSYRFDGLRSPALLKRIGQALANQKWPVQKKYEQEEAAKAFLALVDKTLKENQTHADEIRDEVKNLVKEVNVPMAMRATFISKAIDSAKMDNEMHGYWNAMRQSSDRIDEVKRAIQKYEIVLKTPEKYSNVEEVKKWLKEANESHLPEAIKMKSETRNPYLDIPADFRFELEWVLTQRFYENPKATLELITGTMGPTSGAEYLARQMIVDSAFRATVMANSDVKSNIDRFLKQFESGR